MRRKIILLRTILIMGVTLLFNHVGVIQVSAVPVMAMEDSETEITPIPTETPKSEEIITPTPKPIKNGLVKEDGYYRYYNKGKLLKNQWKDANGKRYYFKSNGNGATYSYKIKGQYYVFNERARLVRPVSNKIVPVGEKKYLADSKGRPKTGWNIVNGKLYYVSKTGECVKSKTIDGIVLTKDCWARDTTDAQLKMTCMKIVKELTTDQMTKSQKLSRCWSYITGGRFWYASKYPNLSSSGWQRSLGLNMLQSKCGNCYGFACGFAALAKEIGYEPVVVCAKVPGKRDGASDGYTRHCWIMIDGRHYDPEAQYAGWGKGIYGYGNYPISYRIQRTVKF